MIARNPQHSRNYADRWERFAAEGKDIVGEARLIDAMVPRGARILDAGCGQGRIGGYLAQAGHTVSGCDIDPYLIACAKAQYPQATWMVGDLSAGEVPDGEFDAIVCAGNVMGFIHPEGRVPALQALCAALAPGGRLAVGFGAGRGYDFAQFREDCAAAGLAEELLLSSWDLRPFEPSADFLVAILGRAERR